MQMMPHQRSRFVGLDVHRATIAVAVADDAEPPASYGTIANDPSAIRKLMGRLGGTEVRLRVAYEARPAGYTVHRQLTALGIECTVVAPSLIPVRPGDKVKTDRRDALKLARCCAAAISVGVGARRSARSTAQPGARARRCQSR
jgi:transposase